jgi:hypothetical protein
MEDMKNGMPAKKGLDVMIAIGTKKGLGMKGEEGGNYKEPMSSEDDMSEDKTEGEMNMCEHCDKEMVCSGCNKPESECSCE